MCCKIILFVLDVINIVCLINQLVLFFVIDQQRGGFGIFIVFVLEDVICVWENSVFLMIDMEVYMQIVLIFFVYVFDQLMIQIGMDLYSVVFSFGYLLVICGGIVIGWMVLYR